MVSKVMCPCHARCLTLKWNHPQLRLHCTDVICELPAAIALKIPQASLGSMGSGTAASESAANSGIDGVAFVRHLMIIIVLSIFKCNESEFRKPSVLAQVESSMWCGWHV